MMQKRFKNTASVPVLGIAPDAEALITVDSDGLLKSAYARGLVKDGHLVEVMPPKPTPPKPAKKETANVGS
jgi:hypothetical protein